MKDQIEQYKKARRVMLHRKEELVRLLAEIDAALAGDATAVKPPRPRFNKPREYGELTAAVAAVLATGPLTKKEIAGRLQAQKFYFGGSPIKILDSVIYTPHFKRSGKQFSLANPSPAK